MKGVCAIIALVLCFLQRGRIFLVVRLVARQMRAVWFGCLIGCGGGIA